MRKAEGRWKTGHSSHAHQNDLLFIKDVFRAGGEIGRRVRLRTVWTKVLEGSSPSPPNGFY